MRGAFAQLTRRSTYCSGANMILSLCILFGLAVSALAASLLAPLAALQWVATFSLAGEAA